MKTIKSLLVCSAFIGFAAGAWADIHELDGVQSKDSTAEVPAKQIVVRTDEVGHVELFKLGDERLTGNDAETLKVLERATKKAENRINQVTVVKELDETSSKDSWYYYSPGYVYYYRSSGLFGLLWNRWTISTPYSYQSYRSVLGGLFSYSVYCSV